MLFKRIHNDDALARVVVRPEVALDFRALPVKVTFSLVTSNLKTFCPFAFKRIRFFAVPVDGEFVCRRKVQNHVVDDFAGFQVDVTDCRGRRQRNIEKVKLHDEIFATDLIKVPFFHRPFRRSDVFAVVLDYIAFCPAGLRSASRLYSKV